MDCLYVELLDYAENFPDRVVNLDNGQDLSLIAQGLWAQALVATWRTARFVHRDFAVRAYDVLCFAGIWLRGERPGSFTVISWALRARCALSRGTSSYMAWP